MFACNGILFNHESSVRGETFVTRKITKAVSRIVHGIQDKLYLGNLDAMRDWGHAKDYVEAMYLMLQLDKPEDFVIGTGITTSIRDFVRLAFKKVGITLEFRGKGADEKGYILSCDNPNYQLALGMEVLSVDGAYFRPTEVDLLVADPNKAKTLLSWEPKYTLDMIVDEMMEKDLEECCKEKFVKESGYRVTEGFEL